MRPHRPSLRITPYASRSGVALIITVIMLSVITFLAVAFLALSGREKGATKTATDQTTARLAADTAFVRAQGELLAGILAAGSVENYGLLVATNYENPLGYNPAPAVQTPGVPNPTNVNYHYANGNLVTGPDALQNLANQLYDASPPVFITNRFFANTMEFRRYLDLNRNRRFDPTGFRRVTNSLNQSLQDTNGLFVTNYVTGDPQWIGARERPDQPASGTNKYVSRSTFVAVPVGKTLDVNYIHNQALSAGSGTMDVNGRDYFRNQGVGAWEINLAAFLYDLNTNDVYGWGLGNAGYFYNPLTGSPASGKAFVDAGGLFRYRLNGRPNLYTYATAFPFTNGLRSVIDLYGTPNPFTTDFVDGYSDGPLVYTNGLGAPSPGLLVDTDVPSRPWVGADQSYHFFTTQDLFDPNKTDTGGGTMFTDRLYRAGTNASTYDQYTFPRLEAQLGTDSAPEGNDRMNLNFKVAGVSGAPSFVPWTPTDFFTNAANRLLAKYTQEWLDTDANAYIDSYKTNQAFGLNNIPVLVSNRFVYTPAVHRLLQLAANLIDIKTNTVVPSIFRPIFTRNNDGIFITGYEEVLTNAPVNLYLTPPLEITELPLGSGLSNNVYGVPWVVGAKKGLPNFNEISMHSLFQVTRKIQITRAATNTPPTQWETNMMYVVGVSNAIGVEAWNSYRNDFTNPVVIRVAGAVTMVLTNEFGIPLSAVGPLSRTFTNEMLGSLISNRWPGYGSGTGPQPRSFVIPVRTNIAFLPESVFRPGAGSTPGTFNTNLNIGFQTDQGFLQPQWGLVTSTRLRLVMQLNDANGPIIDYVQLDDLGGARNLSEEIRDPDGTPGFDGLWATNLVKNSNLPQGVLNQLDISLGNPGTESGDWRSYGRQPPNKELEIDKFRVFCGSSPLIYQGLPNETLVQQVPFTPTRRVLQQLSWQANDPLVHYLAGDLLDIAKTNNIERPALTDSVQLLKNIGVINDRYSPWGGNPINSEGEDSSRYNAAVKDPGVRSSDDWQFPTNTLPNIGSLGRVHRGTPWQTVYLKASDLNISQRTVPISNMGDWLAAYPDPAGRWMRWSGNPDPTNSYFTRPMTDRLLFDVFTTAFNENASRGQLSVNQTNLASWSAVFSGVVALTNSFATQTKSRFDPLVIQPAGVYNAFDPSTWPPLVKLVSGINSERSRSFTNGTSVNYVHPGGWFQSAGDILSVPELTDASPFLNLDTNSVSFQRGVNDVAYEWLPQQVMSLLRLGEPRFVIYAYGQALRPAENSIYTVNGAFFGLCTNYQITAEVAARAVVRVEGSANPRDRDNPNPKRHYPPRLIIESYNYLPPE